VLGWSVAVRCSTRRQLAAGELVASGCLTRLFILAIEYRIHHDYRVCSVFLAPLSLSLSLSLSLFL